MKKLLILFLVMAVVASLTSAVVLRSLSSIPATSGDDDGDDDGGDDDDDDGGDDRNDDGGDGQSDHSLLDPSEDERVYCGVGTKIEPWTLHVAASPGGTSGTLTIRFRDDSAVAFPIPGGDSFSLTMSMGGVPGVDDLVRIDLGTGEAWISASARAGALDPFVEDGTQEEDNFCINVPNEQPSNSVSVTLGVSLYTGEVLPTGFDGNDDGKLD